MSLDLGTLSGRVELDVAGFEKKYADVRAAMGELKKSDPTVTVDADVKAAVDDIKSLGLDGRELAKVFDAAADEIERSLRSAMSEGSTSAQDLRRDAERAADQLADAYKDAYREVEERAGGASQAVGSKTKEGFDEASEGAANFKDEANQTAREVAASFDGSTDSIVGMFQEVAANALGGFGPAAQVAGLAAAAGIGILWSEISTGSEAAAEDVAAMYEDMKKSGAAYLTEAALQQGIDDIIGDEGKWAQAQSIAEGTGVAISTVLRAMAGDQDAVAEAMGAVNDAYAELDARAPSTSGGAAQAAAEARKEVDGWAGALGESTEALDKARARAEAAQGAIRSTAETAQAAADAQSGFAQALDDAAAAAEANGKTLDTTTQAGRDNDAALRGVAAAAVETAEAMLASGETTVQVRDAMRGARQSFIDAAEQMGLTTPQAQAMADTLGLIPGDYRATISLDTAQALEDARTIAAAFGRVYQARTNAGIDVARSQTTLRRAGGGPVHGPGTDTSDSVLARLSNEEHVWTAQEVRGAGGHAQVERLRAQARTGRGVGLAGGGTVTGQGAVTSGPMDLSDRTISRMAAAILAGARTVAAGTTAAAQRDRTAALTRGVV